MALLRLMPPKLKKSEERRRFLRPSEPAFAFGADPGPPPLPLLLLVTLRRWDDPSDDRRLRSRRSRRAFCLSAGMLRYDVDWSAGSSRSDLSTHEMRPLPPLRSSTVDWVVPAGASSGRLF